MVEPVNHHIFLSSALSLFPRESFGQQKPHPPVLHLLDGLIGPSVGQTGQRIHGQRHFQRKEASHATREEWPTGSQFRYPFFVASCIIKQASRTHGPVAMTHLSPNWFKFFKNSPSGWSSQLKHLQNVSNKSSKTLPLSLRSKALHLRLQLLQQPADLWQVLRRQLRCSMGEGRQAPRLAKGSVVLGTASKMIRDLVLSSHL